MDIDKMDKYEIAARIWLNDLGMYQDMVAEWGDSGRARLNIDTDSLTALLRRVADEQIETVLEKISALFGEKTADVVRESLRIR